MKTVNAKRREASYRRLNVKLSLAYAPRLEDV
jgi:hypothetical protein